MNQESGPVKEENDLWRDLGLVMQESGPVKQETGPVKEESGLVKKESVKVIEEIKSDVAKKTEA